MRAGLCSVPQGLTSEAANVVKQAVGLARRRGHAQVTPLHVASAMLASSTGLLRRACLQSHSHPLQCKALELCFNVALNRLPASTSSPLLGPHPPQYPSLSNALVAAFKRAQAHQRRGSIENQQQPILALKIEVEQLIVSILDDPSVSRVMREAGFSSTQVKNKVEQTISLEVCSQTTPVSSQSKETTKAQSQSLPFSQCPLPINKPLGLDQAIRNEDIMSVLNTLATKRRNTVIVGENPGSVEGVIRGVLEKFERGQLPGDLRYVQFINFPLFSTSNLSKDEVDQKLMELRCLVKSYMSRGIVLYLGDLKWVSEFWSSYGDQRGSFFYSSPVEHIVMELKRLVCGIGENGKLWLMGIASFQTYMKCKTGHPSLETLWQLHPLTIPVGSLGLSLKLDSDLRIDSSINFDKEAHSFVSSVPRKESTNTITLSSCSSLPSWLQQHKEESRGNTTSYKECVDVRDLCKKWNSFSSSANSYDRNLNLHHNQQVWPVVFEPKPLIKEHQFWISESSDEDNESNLRAQPIPDLLSNPNSSPNSASSSEAMEDMDGVHGFKELNAENLKILCDALEKKVPWQREIIPEIASTILQCRSGLNTRKINLKIREEKEETWLFFLGMESKGKEKISRELAKVVFGSQNSFVSISLSKFSSSTRADSTEESKRKRTRDELGCSYIDRFSEALNENPHRVFFLEDIEQVDHCSQKGIKEAIKNGEIKLPGGETVPLKDAIVIFSCESFCSVSRAPSPRSQKAGNNETDMKDDNVEGSDRQFKERIKTVSLDLNLAFVEDNNNGGIAEDEDSVGEIGILESVDRKFVFRNHELY